MKHILIVDDDLYIGNMLEEVLQKEGYRTTRAYSGTEALLVLSCATPDLILLDLMLPGLTGEELLPKITGIPVIIISAKAGVENKVGLLLGGAADYVTKPFDIKELLARIAVQFRINTDTVKGRFISFENIRIDTYSQAVLIDKVNLLLTPTEYTILKILVQNQNQVTTKSLLLDRISLDTPDCTEGSLKMHVGNLRRKLRAVTDKDYIEAVWGIGFKLKE